MDYAIDIKPLTILSPEATRFVQADRPIRGLALSNEFHQSRFIRFFAFFGSNDAKPFPHNRRILIQLTAIGAGALIPAAQQEVRCIQDISTETCTHKLFSSLGNRFLLQQWAATLFEP